MKVSRRLVPPPLYRDSQVVEIRYFRFRDLSPVPAVLFGFLEHLSHDKEKRAQLQTQIDRYNTPNVFRSTVGLIVSHTTYSERSKLGVIPYLLSEENSSQDKLAAWNNDDFCLQVVKTEFAELMKLAESEYDSFLEKFITKYDLQLIKGPGNGDIDNSKLQIFWDNIEGQICLLYQRYALDSFVTMKCGHVHLRSCLYGKIANMTGNVAVNEEEFLRSQIECGGECKADISAEAFQIATEAGTHLKKRGLEIFNLIFKEDQIQRSFTRYTNNLCKCCGSAVREKYFTCYCKVCETCAVKSVATSLNGTCPLCHADLIPEYSKSVFLKALGIEGVAIPLASKCLKCKIRKERSEFTIVFRLTDKCLICDECWLQHPRIRNSQCPFCLKIFSGDDGEICNQLRNQREPPLEPLKIRDWGDNIYQSNLSSELNCKICLSQNGGFRMIKKIYHKCRVCDECLLKNFMRDSGNHCPGCNRAYTSDDGPTIDRLMRENLLLTCYKCTQKKSPECFAESKRISHFGKCTTCDECILKQLLASPSSRYCELCTLAFSQSDMAIIRIILGNDKKLRGQIPAQVCKQCRREVKDSPYLCSKRCTCAPCLIKSYIISSETKCPFCPELCEGISNVVMKCSGCFQLVAMNDLNKQEIAAVCDNDCVLCCYCVAFQLEIARCPVCEASVTFAYGKNPAEIQNLQNQRTVGCYCKKADPEIIQLGCPHFVHRQCEPQVFNCRVCRKFHRQRPVPVNLADFIK